MDITADTRDGNVVVTITSGFSNTSAEDLEIVINTEVESDEPEYCEPEYYEQNVMDVASQSVAASFTSLLQIGAGLFVLGLFLSLFE